MVFGHPSLATVSSNFSLLLASYSLATIFLLLLVVGRREGLGGAYYWGEVSGECPKGVRR